MEDMVKMMSKRSPENPRKNSPNSYPTWKLYENPFYITQQQSQEHDHQNKKKQIHQLPLPISARKIAASFWDLSFIKPLMESELESARAQILELKTQLEHERKARKRMVSFNKKLTRELSEEKKGREALETVCEELARQTSNNKGEIERLKREMEEERKMVSTAEILREERVQMKLSEAKLMLEEKISELEEGTTKQSQEQCVSFSSEKSTGNSGVAANYSMAIQRRVSPEKENPHIKRGIKGFVEFPRVVRAIGSKSIRQSGSNLECQKAQIRMLLKHKTVLQSSTTLITS